MKLCLWANDRVWRVSKHAMERFLERFPQLDIKQEFQTIELMEEYRSETYWRSKNGVVFLTKQSSVVTVMTIWQTQENIRYRIQAERALARNYTQEN